MLKVKMSQCSCIWPLQEWKLVPVNLLMMVVMVTALSGDQGYSFESHSCGHKHSINQIQHDVEIEPAHLVVKRSINQQLNINVHFDDSINRLPYDHIDLIKDKVWEAVGYWQNTLMVRPTLAPIRLNRKCLTDAVMYKDSKRYCVDGCAAQTLCGDVVVPDQHLHGCSWWDSEANGYYDSPDNQPGVNRTDFILYVAALSTARCEFHRTVAFAAHCQQEKALDRPVAGYFSICPESISASTHKHRELLYTLKHEILHALGFTAGLYAFYRDAYGQPLTPRDPVSNKPTVINKQLGMYQWSTRVARDVVRYDWRLRDQTIRKTVHMIVTPNVKREVRKHFNCPSLEGAELEDQVLNGTAFTHWEKRVFENEAMTGTYTQNPIISRITLALMEDTGWYKVNYNNAAELEWGRNLGCDFVKRSCYDWMQTRQSRGQDIHPFCNQASRGQPFTDCTRSRKAVAVCNLSEFAASLPSIYQYFSVIPGVSSYDVGKYGGSVAFADYCPYLQELVWKKDGDIIRGSTCDNPLNNLVPSENYLLENYSPSSKCFNHGSYWFLQRCRTTHTPHSGSGCYKYSCSSDTGLTIFVMGQPYQCHWAGQPIPIYYSKVWLHVGNITCPACQEICQEEGVTCPADKPAYITAGDRWRRTQLAIPCDSPNIGGAHLLKLIVSAFVVTRFSIWL